MSNTDEFDFDAFLDGRSRAKDSVTLYLNEEAANEASRHLEYNSQGKAIGILTGHEDDYKAAKEVLDGSALTIHLHGADEGVVDDLRKKHGIDAQSDPDSEEYAVFLVDVLVEQYDHAETADGKVSRTPVDAEKWFARKRTFPRTQWNKLMIAVQSLIYVAVAIDENTNADFLANS